MGRAHTGLTLADVKAAVESGNRNDGAGRLANGENALIVRAVGAIRTLDAPRREGVAVTLEDGAFGRAAVPPTLRP